MTVDNIKALIHPEDWKHLQNAIKPASQNTPSFQTEFRVCRPNGEMRWCIGTAVASADATDNIVRISGVTVDITDRKDAEERQALLAREVDHRARNALALVQSIVRLTRSDTIKSYIAAVDGRIGALSRAHTLLAQSRWQGADLARLVEEELAPYRAGDDGKITANGPDVSLEPRTAQTLALALHELSTNAAKYGALSVHAGPRRGDLGIAAGQSRPALERERRTGHRAAGIARLRHPGDQRQHRAPARGRDRVPLAAGRAALQPARAARRQDRAAGARTAVRNRAVAEDRPALPLRLATGNRVLLVEDEILVAMMMKDILAEFGFSVVGPFSRVAEAMVAAVHEDIDAGIIDVNLGGEFVYPVADVLVARDIPFVFVTGYGVESIESRFAHVPIIKKPVQRAVLQKIFVPAEGEPATFQKRRYGAGRVGRAASAGQS